MARLYSELDILEILGSIRRSKIFTKTIMTLRQRVLLQMYRQQVISSDSSEAS